MENKRGRGWQFKSGGQQHGGQGRASGRAPPNQEGRGQSGSQQRQFNQEGQGQSGSRDYPRNQGGQGQSGSRDWPRNQGGQGQSGSRDWPRNQGGQGQSGPRQQQEREQPPHHQFPQQRQQQAWGKSQVQPSAALPSAAPAQAAPPTQPSAPAGGRMPEQPAAQVSQVAPIPSKTVEPTPAEAKRSKKKKEKKKNKGKEVQPVATPAPTAPGEDKSVKNKGKEVQPVATPAPTAPAKVGDAGVSKKMEKLALKIYNLPKRKVDVNHVGGSHVLDKAEIEVNYLPLKIKNSQLKIYHYDVAFNPEKPKFLLRKAMEEFIKVTFPNRHPAFDGAKNLYVAGQPLPKDTYRDSVKVENDESGRSKEFDITVKLVNDNLNLSKLFDYCRNGITREIPQTEIQATDIALRSSLHNDIFTAAGRSFFQKPPRPANLTGGFELWHGFYQSAIMARKPYLNVDVANKAFPIEQPVLQYLHLEFRTDFDILKTVGLQNMQLASFDRFIRGLKVQYMMPDRQGGAPQKRVYTVTGLAGLPTAERFRPGDDEPETTVLAYYRNAKGYTIKYARLPLLRVGTRGSMLPVELCTIIGNQAVMRKLNEKQTSEMVKNAARPTNERKDRIVENIRAAGYANNPTLREFGIEVEMNFEKVNAIVIKPPSIRYRQGTEMPNKGAWRTDKQNFLNAAPINWGILNFDRQSQSQTIIQNLQRLMHNAARSLGMISQSEQEPVHDCNRRIEQHDIETHLRKFGDRGVKLVIVILGRGDDLYGKVKRASEFGTGVLTQCLKGFTVQNRINPMTCVNILQKVNAKLSGTNHCIAPESLPEILKKAPFMLVGADVTHPAPGAGETPSIAAVAASHDSCGFRYSMMYRLQASREEMIVDLAEIMKAQLLFFFNKNRRLPDSILYFRDGVSEGQFQMVLHVELEGIIRGCNLAACDLKLPYQPKITFLVVQKRHHTRFFPKRGFGDPKNCNVPAGTLVDSKITHPTEIDFYLVSHQSIQGTARPTKYHLLFDENNIGQIELEILTYYLCHLFSRCTRAVSYPAPTYYAHLAAFRARAWWDRMALNMTQLRREQETRGAIKVEITDNYPMFFV